MPLVKSRNTAARPKATPSALGWKELTTKVAGKPAPRYQNNLWIDLDIDLDHANALFHCQDEEHVENHTPRWVTFRADQDCLLTFSNDAVFGRDCVQLFAHKERALAVKDEVGTHGQIVQTQFGVCTMASMTQVVAKTKKVELPDTTRRPPVIVVP